MISQETLPQLLTLLGFTKQGTSYSKTIGAAVLKVDTKEERIPVPPLADQQRLVGEVEALERDIAAAQAVIAAAPAKKQVIMQHYL